MRTLPWLVLLTACAPPGGAAIGLSGAPLTGTLNVHVVAEFRFDEQGLMPISGATIDVGGASVTTDANGDATIATTSSSVTLRVQKSGFVAERWLGVDRDHAVVALAAPISTRTLQGAISRGGGNVSISATTTFSMLRVQPTTSSTAPCAGGACGVMLGVDLPLGFVDVVVLDAQSARIARGLVLDATNTFAIDVSMLAPVALASFDVTLPSSAGFAAVVGVPGVSAPNGVALLTPQSSSGAAMIPPRVGAFGDSTFWYIVRATTADGHGESMMFDRAVGQTPGRVTLPSAFLAVPTAVVSSGTLSITVDPAVALYAIESATMRMLVLHPSGATIDVPTTSNTGFTVRAIDTHLASDHGPIDLGNAERTATRVATLTL
jgi:hypothetical protein